MTTRSKLYERAYTRLRNARPAGVAALVGDDVIELACKRGASKGKWDRVLAAAQQLHAEALQLMDADGAILEIVRLEEERPAQLAKLDDEDELVSGVGQFARLMEIALTASDRAVQRQGEQMSQVLEAALGLMKLATERLERNERMLDKIIRANQQLIEQGGNGAKPSVMDDFAALLGAAKASGFNVEQFFRAHGGNGLDADEDVELDGPAITPDHISAPRRRDS